MPLSFSRRLKASMSSVRKAMWPRSTGLIAWPGQALAYLVGQREILRLREHAIATLGDRFELPAFNAALLDMLAQPLRTRSGLK